MIVADFFALVQKWYYGCFFFSNFILPNNIVIIETIIGVSEMTAVVMTKLWFFDVNSVYRCLLQTVMH